MSYMVQKAPQGSSLSLSKLFALILSFFIINTLAAQPPTYTGTKNASQIQTLGISDQSRFDQLMITVAGVGSNARMTQEQQNLKPYMMPIRKMGFRGTDWSYMLASCLEYYINLHQNYKDNLSPDYIALSLKSQGGKANVLEGLRFLSQVGTVSAAIVPYDAAQIPQSVYATRQHKINNYLHLFQPFASQREKTFEIRKALMRGHPVIVELKANAGFSSLKNTILWESPRALGAYSYTLLIIGYDEKTEAFELMSSWGADWANNGYLWMNYNDLANAAMNGFVMIPE